MPQTVSAAKQERWRETMRLLAARFPAAFTPDPPATRPLAIGTYDQLVAQCPDLDPRLLNHALSWYTRGTAYQRALAAAGALRIALDGTPVEPVSPEHAASARATLHERRRTAPGQPAPRPDQPPGRSAPVWCPDLATLMHGVPPMSIAAKLTLTLREIPPTREAEGFVYLALQNEPRGLPAGVHLAPAPVFLGVPLKAWKRAVSQAQGLAQQGKPFVLVIDAHIGLQGEALLAVSKGIQVVEGKRPAAPDAGG
jgi:ProQ/FINO family